jgi:hypothetical protein
MLKKNKKPQETPKKKTGRVFSSNFRRPNVSFAAALRDQISQFRNSEPQDKMALAITKIVIKTMKEDGK